MRSRSRSSRGGGMPPWLVFLIGIALVFGIFYILQGAQNFLRTGGLGVDEATDRALVIASSTAARVTRMVTRGITPLPTGTPVPECLDFQVVISANVRAAPNANSPVVTGFREGETVCVISRFEDSEWYLIDQNPETRRIEEAYMNEVVLEAVNPTLTPSQTYTPSLTVSPLPSVTPPPSLTARPALPTSAPDDSQPLDDERPTATRARPPTSTVDPNAQPTLPAASTNVANPTVTLVSS